MRIYLDNNATTAIHPEVLTVLGSALQDVFGNASSIHREGQAARRLIEDARESVARLIGATARELVFTSGGTESNNAAIFGAVPAEGRFHIVTTAIEHPSVAEAVRALEERGCAVTRVLPSRAGEVSAEAVIASIGPETKLVAVMLALREVGRRIAAGDPECRSLRSVIGRVLAKTGILFMIAAAADIVATYAGVPPKLSRLVDIFPRKYVLSAGIAIISAERRLSASWIWRFPAASTW